MLTLMGQRLAHNQLLTSKTKRRWREMKTNFVSAVVKVKILTLIAANNAIFSFCSFFALTLAFLESLSASLYNTLSKDQTNINAFKITRLYLHSI